VEVDIGFSCADTKNASAITSIPKQMLRSFTLTPYQMRVDRMLCIEGAQHCA
jgi:hypothetical protein